MATVRQDKVQIEIEINGKQVKNTLADLNKSYKQLNREIQQLTPGTEEFNRKAAEIVKAKKAIDDAKKAYQAFGKETAKVAEESKSFGDKIQALPGKISGAFQSALGPIAGMFAAIGIKDFIGSIITTAGEMEAFEAKAQTVFGSALSSVEDFASKNANAMGLTRREYIATAASAGDLLIPMGFQREEAAKLSTDLVNLSGALSEWSGGQRDSKEVSDILTKALLGEREQLKSLGIAISEADVKQRLLENGQSKLTGQALEQAKALATLELVYEKSTDAQEAFAKNGNTLLRQQAQWRAWFSDLRDGFIKDLVPGISVAAEWLGELVGVGNRHSDQMEEERIGLNALVLEITNLNTISEDRAALIKQLNEQYPEFLGNLDQEKVTNEQLTERLKEVNEQMINKILLQIKEDEITESAERAARARNSRRNAEKELYRLLVEANEKYNISLDHTKTITEQAKDAYDQLKKSSTGLLSGINKQALFASKLGVELSKVALNTTISDKATESSNKLMLERNEILEESGIAALLNSEAEAANLKNRAKNIPLTKEEITLIKERIKVERDIQRLSIELMQDGQEKEIAMIRQQAQERITAIQGTGQQVQDQRLLIEQKMQVDISRVREDYRKKEIERLKKEAKDKIQALAGTAEEVLKAQADIEKQLQVDVSTLISVTEQEQIEQAKVNADLRKQIAGDNAEQITLINTQLQADLLKIQQDTEILRQTSQKEATATSTALTKESYDEQLKTLEDYQQKRLQLIATQRAIEAVQSGADPKQVEQDLKEELIEIEIDFLEAKMALAEQFGMDTLDIQKQIEALRLGIITDGLKREKTERQKELEEFEDDLMAAMALASSVAQQIDQISQLSLETRLNKIEKQKQQELSLVGDNEKRKLAVEQKFEKQKEQAQREAAKRQKVIASVQTVINTAQSIVKTGADLGYPLAIPFQVIAAGVGLAQLAKINSQTFASGGYTGQPGSTVQPDQTGQRPAGIVHEKEWVAPRWMVESPVLSPVISRLEQIREQKGMIARKESLTIMDGLNKLSPSNINYITNTYADGGMVTGPSDQAVTAAKFDTANDVLVQEIRGLKASLREIQFVTVWGEREAAMNASVDAALQNRKMKGTL